MHAGIHVRTRARAKTAADIAVAEASGAAKTMSNKEKAKMLKKKQEEAAQVCASLCGRAHGCAAGSVVRARERAQGDEQKLQGMTQTHARAHDACCATQTLMQEFKASKKHHEELDRKRDRTKEFKGLGRKVASEWKVRLSSLMP